MQINNMTSQKSPIKLSINNSNRKEINFPLLIKTEGLFHKSTFKK